MTTAGQDKQQDFMRSASELAWKSYNEGGLPIGATTVENGAIIAVGHNRRVQHGDPIALRQNDAGVVRGMDWASRWSVHGPVRIAAGHRDQRRPAGPGGRHRRDPRVRSDDVRRGEKHPGRKAAWRELLLQYC